MNLPIALHSNPALRLVRAVLLGIFLSIIIIGTTPAADCDPQLCGKISGLVRDAADSAPLGGATIKLSPSGRKISTDSAGCFTLDNLAPGRYTLIVTFVGYAPDTLSGTPVRSGKAAHVVARLRPLPIEGQTIIVTGAVDPLPVRNGDGAMVITGEQIRSRPGDMGDINRMMAGTPTVARFDDRYANLIVRGGSPMENGYYIDNIPVPNISHFPSQGSSGGPLGLLNSNIIKGALFYTGGFPVAFGDRLSSILEITLRDGNRREFAGEGVVDVTGATVSLEGPLASGRGSWLVCGRHSFLDLLRRAIEFDAVPRYDDLYAKLSFRRDSTTSFEVIGLLGVGDFDIDRDVSHETGFDFYGRMRSATGTVGLAWNHVWPERGANNLSLAFSSLRWTNDHNFTVNNSPLYNNDSREHSVTLRDNAACKLGRRLSVHVGGEARYLAADYDFSLSRYIHETGYLNPPVTVNARPDYFTGGVWLDNEWRLSDRLTAITGVRGDVLGYGAHGHLSPRGSLRLRLAPNFSIYTAAGVYYQSLPLIIVLQHDANRKLRDPRALSFDAGMSCHLTEWFRCDLEVFSKRYDFMPMDTTQPAVFVLDELIYNYGFVAGHLPLVDNGRCDTYGVEATFAIRPWARLSWHLGVAWSRAMYRGVDRVWRDRVIDNRLAADIGLDWRPSDRWVLSSRWVYGGGRPYTPFDQNASEMANYPAYDLDLSNAVRYPAYHSLNIRIERRFLLGGSELSVYTEVWNLYDRENVAGQYWDTDSRSARYVHQFPRLPVLGVEYHF